MPLRDALRRLFATAPPAAGPPTPAYAVVPRPLDPPIHPLALVARQALVAQMISGPDTPLVDKVVFVATPFVVTAAAVHGAQQAVARGQAPVGRQP